MGTVFGDSQRNNPLAAMDTAANRTQAILWDVVCDSLRPRGHPISKTPAIVKYNQAI
jgi:hypothetical protein